MVSRGAFHRLEGQARRLREKKKNLDGISRAHQSGGKLSASEFSAVGIMGSTKCSKCGQVAHRAPLRPCTPASLRPCTPAHLHTCTPAPLFIFTHMHMYVHMHVYACRWAT